MLGLLGSLLETGGGGSTNDKGYFANQAALQAAYPVGEAGWFAVVGSTDTIWVWDTGTSAWINSGASGAVSSVNGQTGVVVLDATDVGAVDKTGDTMTGLLILSGNPTDPLGAAPKQYVDGFSTNIISYTTPGTYSYTPTTGAKIIQVFGSAGGGGGGGGAKHLSTSASSGGGGGGSGSKAYGVFNVSALTTPISITVGAGGSGGAGASSNSTAGTSGANGGATIIGSILRAGRGGFGQGGQIANGSFGGGAGSHALLGALGDASGQNGGSYAFNGSGNAVASSNQTTDGFTGGAGSGSSSTGAAFAGGAYFGVNCGGGSGAGLIANAVAGQAGGSGGLNQHNANGLGGAAGVAGNSATSGTIATRGFTGLAASGGGGGGSSPTVGGNGGAGGQFGGGGGGGASCQNGGTAGNGGAGGNGAVFIIEYF